MRKLVLVILLTSSLIFIGCNSIELVSELSQDQAREIIAALTRDGVSAAIEKGSGARPKYVVTVPKGTYLKAIQLLQDQGLPKPPRRTLDEYNASGLLPTSREMELLKADRALALDIEDMLSEVPSVFSSHAVVRSHGQSEPSVSITVVTRKPDPITEDQVREVAYRVIPGVKPENTWVKVSISKTVNPLTRDISTYVPFLSIAKVAEEDHLRLASIMTIALLLFAVLGIVVGYSLSRVRLKQQRTQTTSLALTMGGGNEPVKRDE